MKLDLAIRGGTVITFSDSSRCDVGVRVCFGMQFWPPCWSGPLGPDGWTSKN
jgi:hypothetical protein